MVRESYQDFSEEDNEKSKYMNAKDIEIFLKKKKSEDMVTNNTKISQKMKTKSRLSTEKLFQMHQNTSPKDFSQYLYKKEITRYSLTM